MTLTVVRHASVVASGAPAATQFAIACCWSCLNRLTRAKMPAATLSPRWIASAMAKLDTMRRLLMRQPKNPNTASAARKVNMTDWIQTATKSSCASGAVSSWESDKYTSMEEHWTYSGAQFEYTHTQRQTHRRASPLEKGPVNAHCHQHLLFVSPENNTHEDTEADREAATKLAGVDHICSTNRRVDD